MRARTKLLVLFGLLACKREGVQPDVVTPTDAGPTECLDDSCKQPDAASQRECAIDDECPSKQICDGGQCVQVASDEPGEAVCGIATLYFGFGSARLTPNNQERLANAAPCLIELLKPGGELLLAACSDDSEQALATDGDLADLADHRGRTVREFLISLGVPAEQLRVVDDEAPDRRVQLNHVPP